MTFNAGNTANSDLLLVGTHTAQVTDGTNITDLAGNPATTAPAAVPITGTGGPTAPVIAARETIDNDADGQIDHIRITADQALNDNFGDLTITVSGYTITGYVTEIGAGGDNDNVFYVQLTESGSPDTGVRPTVLVTANTLLTDFGGSNPVAPDPTPDSKIAFQTNRDGNEEIYVMDADGSNQINLTNNAAVETKPSWSPDGSQIVFDSDRDGNWEIYIMDADGSNPTNLTNNAADDQRPAWSPDGSKIAFGSDRDGSLDEIYVMNTDGSNPVRLTNNTDNDLAPSWSPDSSKIAFRSFRDGNGEIYVMDADGSNQINFTNNAADDGNPEWSPDGSQIAFRSMRDGDWEIYVMDADGSNPINLTNNAAYDSDPSWSPNGQPDRVSLGPRRQLRDLRDGRRRNQSGKHHKRPRGRHCAGLVARSEYTGHRLRSAGAPGGPLEPVERHRSVPAGGRTSGLHLQRDTGRAAHGGRARSPPGASPTARATATTCRPSAAV